MSYQWFSCMKKTFCNFCNNTPMHCYKYIVEADRKAIERVMWCLIHMLVIGLAVYVFYIMSENFWKAPIITTLDKPNHNIYDVPFPAVAVCDVNRISRHKAWQFALDKAQDYNISVDKMFFYTKYLGRLYDYDDENLEILSEFNNVMDSSKHNVQFDYDQFMKIMMTLTPSIDDMLLECWWKAEQVKCSELFSFRRTMDGFCATFNYIKSSDHFFLKEFQNTAKTAKAKTLYLDASGTDMGLTIVVNSNVSDYYYPSDQMEGLKVFLFNTHDYPDLTSGGLVESLIPLGMEVHLQIDPFTVEAVPILRDYTVSQRGCLFEDEGTTAFDSQQYSHTDCLSECRMKTILALCECVPFQHAVSQLLPYARQLCTAADVPCLNRYKERWNTISMVRHGQLQRELADDVHNSIDCSHCLSDCSFTKYQVMNEYTPLVSTNQHQLKEYENYDISVIHIYFDVDKTMLYKTDLMFFWYEIVGNFGGMCGVFIGFSVISIIEFLYFMVCRFCFLLVQTKQD